MILIYLQDIKILQIIIKSCRTKITFTWESFSSLPLDGRGESAAANSWANDGLGDAGITGDGLWITLLGFGPGFRRAETVSSILKHSTISILIIKSAPNQVNLYADYIAIL